MKVKERLGMEACFRHEIIIKKGNCDLLSQNSDIITCNCEGKKSELRDVN